MKKKHYLIFILVIVAGVISGFTFGNIVNDRHASNQVAAASSHAAVKIKKKVADSAPPPVVAAPDTKKMSAELPPVVVNNVGDKLDMTATDVSEVEKMLNTVGVPADKEYSQRIVKFQKSNNINPTGILDQQTLETLINQATLKFADQRIGKSKDVDS